MAFQWVVISETEARARLKRAIAFTQEPLLDETHVDDLMFLARKADRFGVWPDRHTFWKPLTAYSIGQTIVPTVRNGHFYTVRGAGTSGPVEPTWSLGANSFVDDNDVTLQEAGVTVWQESWDLNLAAAEGWRRKAGLAANAYNFAAEGMSLNRNQIYEHCLEMSRKYGGKVVGSISLAAGRPGYTTLEKWANQPPEPHLLYDETRQERVIIPGVETNWD